MKHCAPRLGKVDVGDVFHLDTKVELTTENKMKRGYYLVVEAGLDATDVEAPGSNKITVVSCGNAPERRITDATKMYTFNQIGDGTVPQESNRTYLGPQNVVGRMFRHQTVVFNDKE